MQKPLTLYELNCLVRDLIDLKMRDSYWVQAELSQVREVSHNCYMELIQKDKASNTPIARAAAKCWRSTWLLLGPAFERITGQTLHAGMKVLLQVKAQFHENYGFSWIVEDIDPDYTLGDMARKRQEIIRQLKEEGVLELQKELQLSLFAQRIAVISSGGAAGYGDFCHQLSDNAFGFWFETELFQATMQGEGVEKSIIQALNAIFVRQDAFDAVVIIRGGGATSDLSGFDTLELAENVANFPLPVITGIGHDRDESVLDIVSYARVKTPTAAADFLVDHLQETYNRIEEASERITDLVQRQLQMEKLRLNRLSEQIPSLFLVVKTKQESRLDRFRLRLLTASRQLSDREKQRVDNCAQRLPEILLRKIEREQHRLQLLDQRISSADPQQLLRRGYSITLYHGKSVRDAAGLKSGDELETRLSKGVVKSIVK
ncbi:exodeoxyribonuclease VII large subunit [Prevotella cerevisiae]|uniref:Exodeoxyribonuclease 7 large subunit n=1 Tax=Segatella cerevisiae TaxID=2053716 RepID=A0ABT1BYA7_9BACT|nr:exodeoxyribonuclease VII large subunit [Segatella cerevisiae]MCO6026066.1 exodeoxyribonuclease VII large subunit [Segatella cerevisiae]